MSSEIELLIGDLTDQLQDIQDRYCEWTPRSVLKAFDYYQKFLIDEITRLEARLQRTEIPCLQLRVVEKERTDTE